MIGAVLVVLSLALVVAIVAVCRAIGQLDRRLTVLEQPEPRVQP